jgi:galactonate dehydratase
LSISSIDIIHRYHPSISSIDIIQTDINHCGGIASIHVDAAMPNFLVQEIRSGVESGVKEKIWEEWFGFPAMRLVNGKYPLPTKPGLGFDLDEKQVARYRFAGTRPMARVFHPDGSVAAW